MWDFKTVVEYHDYLASVVLQAPDRFYDVCAMSQAADQPQELERAFDQLRSQFHLIRRKLNDEHLSKICQTLIDMALEAYASGDSKVGAHTLQEARGMIWPSWAVRPKYAVEAERRAFGSNSLFADVMVSPYPYEGTANDLGSDQAELLALAKRWCETYQLQRREFKHFVWAISAGGIVSRVSAEPKEDEHPILKPIQRSLGLKRLKELAKGGEIRACVIMSILAPQGEGIVTFDLEQLGHPRVSARQRFKQQHGAIAYDAMRFHLEDPDIFPEGAPGFTPQ